MSRSATLVEKPFSKTLKFKQEKFNKKKKEVEQEAGFYYFKKGEGEEKGTNVFVPMPLRLIWLETAQSVTGFNSKEEKSVFSNEILPLNPKYDKTLRVKIGDRDLVKGLWKDIKEKVTDAGGKYCAPMYAVTDLGEGPEIIRILLSGGSRELAFENQSLLREKAVEFFEVEEAEMKTGSTYQKPVYKFVDATPEELQLADKLVSKVDAYFEYIFSEKTKSSPAEESSPIENEEIDDDDVSY